MPFIAYSSARPSAGLRHVCSCLFNEMITQYYGRIRQWGRPVGARYSMGLGRNPLINGLIQHTFNLNFLFVEKLQMRQNSKTQM